jgi:uncharacterized protein YndB with AHSA1/START domain
VKRDLSFEMVYPNRPEEVWRALTNPDDLADWLMENDFAPRIGHKFHFRSKSRFGFERIIPCEVVEVDEPRVLSYLWGSEGSVVTFRLEPVSQGTRLRLEHKGLSGLRGLALAWVLGHGWVHKIEQRLPAVLSNAAMQEAQ